MAVHIFISLSKHGLKDTIVKEVDVKLPSADDVNIYGNVKTRTSYGMDCEVKYEAGSLIIMKKDEVNGHFFLLDDNLRGDRTWHLDSTIALVNAKFLTNCIVKGTITSESAYDIKKYSKEIRTHSGFFVRDGIPVMSAKALIIDKYTIHGKGLK